MDRLLAGNRVADATDPAVPLLSAPPAQALNRSDCLALPNGFVLYMVHRRLRQDHEDVFPGEDKLKFHIQVSGRVRLRFERAGEIAVAGPSSVMLHHQDGRAKIERTVADGETMSATVALSRARFLEYLDAEQTPLPEALLHAGRHDLQTARLCQWRASASEAALARSIVHCRYTGSLRQIFLESKALEIVYRVLARTDGLGQTREKTRIRLSERDRARLMQIRERLESDFMHVPSLADLGRRVGLNRNKLCFGFRQLFGFTIAEFCAERRMERARALLLGTQMSVSEIAFNLGYSSSGNFSTAFQKRFGCAPGFFRRAARA